MRPFSNARGFTLVEMLAALAVVSILMTLVFANIQSGKQKARDAQRKSDLGQVQIALRLFKDTYGRYPSNADAPGKCTHTTSTLADGCLQVLVTKGLLHALPANDVYYYDNWCRAGLVGEGSSDRQYRMWVMGETNNDGIANNWWDNKHIGITTCTDPS